MQQQRGRDEDRNWTTTISVAPNGGRLTKADHPSLPLGPAELARTARDCLDAGASLIHVHVRDREGRHLLEASSYCEVIDAIREEVGYEMVIQITSESLGRYRPQEQIAVVKNTRPEAVSLALRELVPTEAYEKEFSSFLSWLKNEAIVPQIILYEADEAFRLAEFCRRGLVPWSQIPVLFVLGRYSAGQKSKPVDLLPFIGEPMPHFAHWSVCAFGAREAACVTAAALLGGHVRVGFENNRQLPGGEFAKSNAELVGGISKVLMELGLRRTNADELRRAWQVG